MATLQHPTHEHPLREKLRRKPCRLCGFTIPDHAYACEDCKFFVHKRCAEAPSWIRCHPFHPLHSLTLVHGLSFRCDACRRGFNAHSTFRCEICNFDLDINCALATLPADQEGCPGTTPEHTIVSLHEQPLASFSARWVTILYCVLCNASVEGDGYICLQSDCQFVSHQRCVRDRYAEDGGRISRVYHKHEQETSSVEEGSLIKCMNCKSDIQGECIGCGECKFFYHQDCIRSPQILRYPPHPIHALVLFIYALFYPEVECQSCSLLIEHELCYRCIFCDFALHLECALQTISYIDRGASTDIVLSWHEHPMLLCHRTDDADCCSGCGNNVCGLAYRCSDLSRSTRLMRSSGSSNCGLLLDKPCTELRPEIDHPHHPDHPLRLLAKSDGPRPRCEACCEDIVGFSFYCELCVFHLDVKCASRVPTQKHYFHEHDLVYFKGIPSLDCNRCGTSTDSPLFRCVPCDFNLHEKCMELPPFVKHKTHFHPLTLRETFVEDDSGEYYCDLCEKRRDGRLGVYVCGLCKMDRPWAFHIECILPELRNVNVKKACDSSISRLAEEITTLEIEIEEPKGKLDELRKKRDELVSLKTKVRE